MIKTYAGIGSRRTPRKWLTKFSLFARELYESEWILRSGGANGADKAFELGVPSDEYKEIYLPWKGFNLNRSDKYGVDSKAFKLARHFHPAFDSLSDGAKKLIARNAYQILGADLNSPCAFVLCWTLSGSGTGGTGQAIRIAQANNIPVYDFGNPMTVHTFKDAYEHLFSLLDIPKTQ